MGNNSVILLQNYEDFYNPTFWPGLSKTYTEMHKLIDQFVKSVIKYAL